MDVKEELLQCCVEELVEKFLSETEYDLTEKINEKAIAALAEIKNIISNYDFSDIEAIENIVYVLEKYNIGCGGIREF